MLSGRPFVHPPGAGVPASPSVRVRVKCNGVTETSGSLDLAERIDGANDGVGLPPVGERSLQAVKHGHAGDGGVDGEKDIVCNDECLEPPVAGDPPWLVSTMLAVVPVEVGEAKRRRRRQSSRGPWGRAHPQKCPGESETVRESRFAAVGVRDGRWRSIWEKLQKVHERTSPGKRDGPAPDMMTSLAAAELVEGLWAWSDGMRRVRWQCDAYR